MRFTSGLRVCGSVRLRSKERRMRIERDQRGDYVLDATALAKKLSIPSEDLRRRMRLGLVASLVEAGEGEDAGLRRLTMRCGAEVWRAVIDANDRIVGEDRVASP